MHLSELFSPKKNSFLIGHEDKFYLFQDLLINKRMPKVLMLSGRKGIGKFTLINHLMHYYFDKENYDKKQFKILDSNSSFKKQYLNNVFPNIIYLNSLIFSNVKVEEIRNLKANLLKTPINNLERFIILDDVENFNVNSLNALLKIIEEPSRSNYFILINNKSKPILETIKSRCLEVKIILKNSTRDKILSSLLEYYEQDINLEKDLIKITPGLFLKYNSLFNKEELNIDDGFFKNFMGIINMYKKEKDLIYRDLLIYFTEYFFEKNEKSSSYDKKSFFEKRFFILKNINNFFTYNLNHNTLIHSIEAKLNE